MSATRLHIAYVPDDVAWREHCRHDRDALALMMRALRFSDRGQALEAQACWAECCDAVAPEEWTT